MSQPDYEQARAYALSRLAHDLDPALCYHSLTHTRDDVAPAMERLAQHAGISGEALLLLRTAAYFHDLGFVERRAEHESAGVQIAAAVLPGYGYTPGQIAQISGMIMATRLPQSPRNLHEQLMADSDLDLLGRDDFLPLNGKLRAELAHFRPDPGTRMWFEGQLAFLREHRYWTDMARQLRDSGKRRNIARIEQLLSSCAP